MPTNNKKNGPLPDLCFKKHHMFTLSPEGIGDSKTNAFSRVRNVLEFYSEFCLSVLGTGCHPDLAREIQSATCQRMR